LYDPKTSPLKHFSGNNKNVILLQQQMRYEEKIYIHPVSSKDFSLTIALKNIKEWKTG
jgi:hypothetical protein